MDPDSLCPDVKFIEQMGSLLDDEEHCDVTFFVGPSKTEVCATCTLRTLTSGHLRMIFSFTWETFSHDLRDLMAGVLWTDVRERKCFVFFSVRKVAAIKLLTFAKSSGT